MSAPVYNSIMVGAYRPYLNTKITNQGTNLLLHDYYPEVFQKLGIQRHEMLPVMKAYTSTDPLTGTAKLEYIDKYC